MNFSCLDRPCLARWNLYFWTAQDQKAYYLAIDKHVSATKASSTVDLSDKEVQILPPANKVH